MPQDNDNRAIPDWWWAVVWISIVVFALVLPAFLQNGRQSIDAVIIGLCVAVWVVTAIAKTTTRKFWRENRWIVMPAVFVLLVWIISTWAQSCLSVENLQSLQMYPPEKTGSVAQATYPRQILHDTTKVPPLSLWLSPQSAVTITPAVTLTSNITQVMFALKEDTLNWRSDLKVDLPLDGTEKVILLRRPDLPDDLNVKLTVEGASSAPISIGTVFIEGQDTAKKRALWLGLLQTSSVIIAIVTAVFAGFKQMDEQKRSERKKEVDDVIRRTEGFKYERGKVKEFLESSLPELIDWGDWLSEQQTNYQNAFLKLINTVEKSADLLEISSSEPSSWTDPAKQIVSRIQPANAKSILETIKQQEPDYSPELDAVHFPPEKYPCHKWFLRQAILPLPQNSSRPGWGIEEWKMGFPPFGDAGNPFTYVRDEDFPLLSEVRFPIVPIDRDWLNHRTYHFQTDWDVCAGSYQYCRRFNLLTADRLRQLSQRTFFVNARADEVPLWNESLTFEDYLLHNLAASWLRLLANKPDITDKIALAKREAVARLLVWHYGSSAAIQAISLPPDAAILKHFQAVKPETSLTSNHKTRFLSLRPPGTDHIVFLSVETSSDKMYAALQPLDFSLQLSEALSNMHAYVIRFVCAADSEQTQLLKMKDDDLLTLLDSRIRLSSSGTLQAFEGLFYPQLSDELTNFIARANGSPGTMVKMARNLLERHIQQHPTDPVISPKALLE